MKRIKNVAGHLNLLILLQICTLCESNSTTPVSTAVGLIAPRGLDVCYGACGANTECRLDKGIPYCYCVTGTTFKGGACTPIPTPGSPTTGSFDDPDRECNNGVCINPCKNHECPMGAICYYIKSRRTSVCLSIKGGINHDRLKKKFFFVDSKMKQLDAISYCNDRNMDLATIDNEEENVQLTKYLRKLGKISKEPVWIGGRDYKEDKQFIYNENGFEVDYTPWSRSAGDGSQPGDCPVASNYECVAMMAENSDELDKNSRRWCKFNCLEKHKAICQYYELK